MSLFRRERSIEDIDREVAREEVLAKEYLDTFKRLSQRKKGEGFSFLEERGEHKPKSIWASYIWDMERATSEEEAEQIRNKYTRTLQYGIGGYSKETAERALDRRWRLAQKEEMY